MIAEYIQRGESLDYRNSTEELIPAGAIVDLKTRIGVAGMDIAPGELGSIHVMGVFAIPKDTSTEVKLGAALYYDSEGQPKLGYIPTSSLTEQYVPTCEYDIPSYSGFKSYMGFDKITSVSSPAYRISRMSAPDEHGLMTYRGRYLIAVGMFFDVSVGDYLDLTLANGSVIRCIVGDRKAMAHTDPSGLFTSANHCMSEFIVSESVLDPTVKKYGDVSCIAAWNSPVVHVTTYQKNALSEPGAAAVAP